MKKGIYNQLHDEMFSLMDNGIENEDLLVESLSEILYYEYGYDDSRAEATAKNFVQNHYVEIDDEVQRAQEDNSEYYEQVRHDYYTSVMGVH